MKKRRNWSRKLSTKTKFDCEESRKKFVAQSRLVFAAALSMAGGKEYRFQREYLGFQVAELCRRVTASILIELKFLTRTPVFLGNKYQTAPSRYVSTLKPESHLCTLFHQYFCDEL
jgi:hypothetical protein